MKIKNLEVKNFKSCPDGTYALSQINVLLGKMEEENPLCRWHFGIC